MRSVVHSLIDGCASPLLPSDVKVLIVVLLDEFNVGINRLSVTGALDDGQRRTNGMIGFSKNPAARSSGRIY